MFPKANRRNRGVQHRQSASLHFFVLHFFVVLKRQPPRGTKPRSSHGDAKWRELAARSQPIVGQPPVVEPAQILQPKVDGPQPLE
jgi:hypothetical protein